MGKKKTMKKLGILGIILGGVMLLLCIGCFAAWYFLPMTWVDYFSFGYGSVSREMIMRVLDIPTVYGADYSEVLGTSYTIFKIASIARWILLGLGVMLLGAGILFLILGKGASSAKAAPAAKKAAPAKSAPAKTWNRCPSCGTACSEGVNVCPACGTRLTAAPKASGVKCPSCGHDCPSGVQFCPACGTRLSAPAPKPAVADSLVCAVCGTENPLEARFCRGCGKPLTSAKLSGMPDVKPEADELFRETESAPVKAADVSEVLYAKTEPETAAAAPAPAPEAEAPVPGASRIRTSLRTTSDPDVEKPAEEKPKFNDNPFMNTPSDL